MTKILIVFLIVILYRWLFPRKLPTVLSIFFGVPGSGKTTKAAHLVKWALHESWVITLCKKYPSKFSNLILSSPCFKRMIPVYSNVPITGAYVLEPNEDIGHYMIVGAIVIIDEAGIQYNNRNFKSFPQEALYWYKYFRHYECSIFIFSQSYEDMDITLRRLAQYFYVVRKSIYPKFIACKKIRCKIGIDKMTHQPVTEYYFGFPILDTQWIFAPPLWKMFNSFSRKEYPQKDWEVW